MIGLWVSLLRAALLDWDCMGSCFRKYLFLTPHVVPGPKGDGSLYFGQTAQVIGVIFVLVGVFMSTKLVFADNLSRRWRIIHFIASVVIAIFFFSVGGQRP